MELRVFTARSWSARLTGPWDKMSAMNQKQPVLDDMRWYGVVIYRHTNGEETYDNLEASSETGSAPPKHCELHGVKWSSVAEKFRGLNLEESDDLSSIEAMLNRTPCQIRVKCRASDLEAIGFKCR